MEQIQPKWKKNRERRHVTLSASQLTTAELCVRKWWLQKVRRLQGEIPSSRSLIFGTGLHAVCERYLLADELDRDKSGAPVNLFPEGWEIQYNKYNPKIVDGMLTPEEQAKCQRLVMKGLSEGVLQRKPNVQVEYEFRETIGEFNGVKVDVVGFIDVLYDDEIQDHKTSKATKWLRTKDKLKRDPQMLLYANALVRKLQREGKPVPEEITLRHNQYVTGRSPDEEQVKFTEVRVNVEVDVLPFWDEYVVPRARQMVEWRDAAEMWSDLPDPQKGSNACNAYGGCEFRPICGGVENEETFELRVAGVPMTGYGSATPMTQTQETTMSFASKLAARQGTATPAQGTPAPAPAPMAPVQVAAPAAPAPAPVQVAAPAPATGADVQTAAAALAATAAAPPPPAPQAPAQAAPACWVGDTPHWADPTCTACGGCGFNRNGEPCRICLASAAQRGVAGIEGTTVQATEGQIVWDGPHGGGSALPAGQVAPQAAAPAPQPAAPAAPAAEAPVAAPAAPAPEEAAEDAKKDKGGRPKKGFVLCVGCVPLHRGKSERKGSGRHIYHLDEFFLEVANALALQNKVGSYFDLDPFKRREMFTLAGEELATEIGTDILVAPKVTDPDRKALLDAITPFAGMTFYGI